jgi:hypothetical protein
MIGERAMTPLITTRQLYEAAANRTPIYAYFEEETFGPALIDELTDVYVKLRGIEDDANYFLRAECSFYTD